MMKLLVLSRSIAPMHDGDRATDGTPPDPRRHHPRAYVDPYPRATALENRSTDDGAFYGLNDSIAKQFKLTSSEQTESILTSSARTNQVVSLSNGTVSYDECNSKLVRRNMYQNTPCDYAAPAAAMEPIPLDLTCMKTRDLRHHSEARESDSPLDLSMKTRRTVADSTDINSRGTSVNRDLFRANNGHQRNPVDRKASIRVNGYIPEERQYDSEREYSNRNQNRIDSICNNRDELFISTFDKSKLSPVMPDASRQLHDVSSHYIHEGSVEKSPHYTQEPAHSYFNAPFSGDQRGVTARSDSSTHHSHYANKSRILTHNRHQRETHLSHLNNHSLTTTSPNLPHSPHSGSTSPYLIPNSPRGSYSHPNSPGFATPRSHNNDLERRHEDQSSDRSHASPHFPPPRPSMTSYVPHHSGSFSHYVKGPVKERGQHQQCIERIPVGGVTKRSSPSRRHALSIDQLYPREVTHQQRSDCSNARLHSENDRADTKIPECELPPTLSLVSPEVKHLGSTPPSPTPTMPVLSPYNKTPPGKTWFPPCAPPPLLSVTSPQNVSVEQNVTRHHSENVSTNQKGALKYYPLPENKKEFLTNDQNGVKHTLNIGVNEMDANEDKFVNKPPHTVLHQHRHESRSLADHIMMNKDTTMRHTMNDIYQPNSVVHHDINGQCVNTSRLLPGEAARYTKPDSFNNCSESLASNKNGLRTGSLISQTNQNGLIQTGVEGRSIESVPGCTQSREGHPRAPSRDNGTHAIGVSGNTETQNDVNKSKLGGVHDRMYMKNTQNLMGDKSRQNLCLPFLIYGEVLLNKGPSDQYSKTTSLVDSMISANFSEYTKRQEWDNSVIDLTETDGQQVDGFEESKDACVVLSDSSNGVLPLDSKVKDDEVNKGPMEPQAVHVGHEKVDDIKDSNKPSIEIARGSHDGIVPVPISPKLKADHNGRGICLSDGDLKQTKIPSPIADTEILKSPSLNHEKDGVVFSKEIVSGSKTTNMKNNSLNSRLSVKCSAEYKKLCPLMKKVSLTLEKEMQRRNTGILRSPKQKSKLLKADFQSTKKGNKTELNIADKTAVGRDIMDTNKDAFDFCGSENEGSPDRNVRLPKVKRFTAPKRSLTDHTNLEPEHPIIPHPKKRRKHANVPDNADQKGNRKTTQKPAIVNQGRKKSDELKHNTDSKHKRKFLTKKAILKCRLNELEDSLTPSERLDGRRPRKRYHKNEAYEEELAREERRKALLRAKRRQRQQFHTQPDQEIEAQVNDKTPRKEEPVVTGVSLLEATPPNVADVPCKKRLGRPPKSENRTVKSSSPRRPIGRPKGQRPQTAFLKKSRTKYTKKLQYTINKVPLKRKNLKKEKKRGACDIGKCSDYLPDLLLGYDNITHESVSDDVIHLPDDIKAEDKNDIDFADDATIIYDPDESEEPDTEHNVDQSASTSCSLLTSLPVPPEFKRLQVNKNVGETVLHRAARLGYEDVVTYCIEAERIGVNVRDHGGYTPLHECCVRGNLRVAKRLIDLGANVNSSAQDGTRPIHDAIACNRIEMVRLLLSSGADPTLATYSGRTCRKIAHTKEMKEFLQGYEKDLNGSLDAAEASWQFHSSSLLDSLEDPGFDVFGDVPSDDDVREHEPRFDCSDNPHLPAFTLQLEAENGPSNYHLLRDVLASMKMDRNEFFNLCGNVSNVTVTCDVFRRHVTESQLSTHEQHTNCPPSKVNGETKPIEYIELVRLDDNLRKHLCITSHTLSADGKSPINIGELSDIDNEPTGEYSPLHHSHSRDESFLSSYCDFLDRPDLEADVHFDHPETSEIYSVDTLQSNGNAATTNMDVYPSNGTQNESKGESMTSYLGGSTVFASPMKGLTLSNRASNESLTRAYDLSCVEVTRIRQESSPITGQEATSLKVANQCPDATAFQAQQPSHSPDKVALLYTKK